ncbi:hypothetical protein [Desertivibrio insolitus]|uniref:hypothetical protein n=1 Tax=Herbiconiux sp. SYSU D00978 TaxID=2812562 RepID=UPI001A96BDB3|nr:hypothetical protein [Herbiconiux sp. SYSU D00978]
MRRRLTGAAVALALALTGCTGAPAVDPPPAPEIDLSEEDLSAGNGLWYLDGATALERIVEATRDAGNWTYSGSLVESVPVEDAPPVPGRRIDFAVTGSDTAYSASITAAGQQLEIVVADGAGYVRGNEAFAARAGRPELTSGYVCLTADDPLLAEWADVTEPGALLDALLGATELGVTPPAPGATTATLVPGIDGAPIGTLTVAAEGDPLPGQLVLADTSGSANVTFGGWGSSPAPAAPTELSAGC